MSRLPPGGARVPLAELTAAWREPDPRAALEEGLRRWLGAGFVHTYRSGREALRAGLVALAARSRRDEVVVPAYTCFSVPSAVVAAGLRVRLVDVTPEGRIDLDALEGVPLERAAAIVVCNLFGIAEALEPIEKRAAACGTAVIDDAAQALGARAADGLAGARGDLGVLSFGRGKPLSALGGGALVSARAPRGLEARAPAPPRRARALARALAWNAARSPRVFAGLARIPALHIGETRFDPDFARGGLDGASLVLAAAALPGAAAAGGARAGRALELAARVRAQARFAPILASPPQDGVYPRLALRAPDPAARGRALAALARLGAGASPLYPSSLDAVAALRPYRTDSNACRGASELAARLLTLPTSGALAGARLRAALAALAGI